MTTPLYIALEGPHGAGKSTLADALAEALSRDGIDARAFHHEPADASLTPWQRALYFAAQRADLVADIAAAHRRYTDAPQAVVCDRWTLSTWLDLAASQESPVREALHTLTTAEDRALPSVRYAILDAPEDVLRVRLEARGETHDEALAERYRFRARVIGWPIIDTSQPRDAVLAQLVAIVRGWL